jgi:hypothetical protein
VARTFAGRTDDQISRDTETAGYAGSHLFWEQQDCKQSPQSLKSHLATSSSPRIPPRAHRRACGRLDSTLLSQWTTPSPLHDLHDLLRFRDSPLVYPFHELQLPVVYHQTVPHQDSTIRGLRAPLPPQQSQSLILQLSEVDLLYHCYRRLVDQEVRVHHSMEELSSKVHL